MFPPHNFTIRDTAELTKYLEHKKEPYGIKITSVEETQHCTNRYKHKQIVVPRYSIHNLFSIFSIFDGETADMHTSSNSYAAFIENFDGVRVRARQRNGF
jgi:hypothetical protein